MIVDATAPRRIWREAARTLIPCFAEVLLLGPADVCVERERAAHWGLAAARDVGDSARGPAPNIVLDYEESFRPDWTVRTDLHDAWSAAQHILILVSA